MEATVQYNVLTCDGVEVWYPLCLLGVVLLPHPEDQGCGRGRDGAADFPYVGGRDHSHAGVGATLHPRSLWWVKGV